MCHFFFLKLLLIIVQLNRNLRRVLGNHRSRLRYLSGSSSFNLMIGSCRDTSTIYSCEHRSPRIIRELRSNFRRCGLIRLCWCDLLFSLNWNFLGFRDLILVLVRFLWRFMLCGRRRITVWSRFLLLLRLFWLSVLLPCLRLMLFPRLVRLFFYLWILPWRTLLSL